MLVFAHPLKAEEAKGLITAAGIWHQPTHTKVISKSDPCSLSVNIGDGAQEKEGESNNKMQKRKLATAVPLT